MPFREDPNEHLQERQLLDADLFEESFEALHFCDCGELPEFCCCQLNDADEDDYDDGIAFGEHMDGDHETGLASVYGPDDDYCYGDE